MNKPKYVIVVGIDYSTASERALDEAFELAVTKHGVQLHIVNVRSAFSAQTAFFGALVPLPPWQDWATELREYVARKVTAFQATAGVAPFHHLYTHQRMNDPAHELVQLAADVEADLLVVGTHDWRGVARLGSVAETVSRTAPCPVLVVRRKALPAPMPAIEPPCPACIASRDASNGESFWCEQHSEHHGRRHTYHQSDRMGAETNFPLVGPR